MKVTTLIAIAALTCMSTAQAQTIPLTDGRFFADIEKPNDADPRIGEICLRGVRYYVISVHGGYALAPVHLPLTHYTGQPVTNREGKVVVNSSPEPCITK